jgi:hypothetical protein
MEARVSLVSEHEILTPLKIHVLVPSHRLHDRHTNYIPASLQHFQPSISLSSF